MENLLATFWLVFVALPPQGPIEVAVVSVHDGYVTCVDEIAQFEESYGLPLGTEPLNWAFVCLQDTQDRIRKSSY